MEVGSSDVAPPPRRRVRWGWLGTIVLAGGALLAGLQYPGIFVTDQDRNLATIAAEALVAGMCALWAILGTGLAPAKKWRALAAASVAVVVAVACVRVDGFWGDLTPRLNWRWAARPDDALVADTAQKPSAAQRPVADLSQTTEDDFPRFLGPDGNAAIEAPPFDTNWNAHPPHLLWKKPIGAGWSSFAVVGDYAVTQEQRGDREYVTCYALKSGKLLWQHSDAGEFRHPMSGDGPRSTPTIDQGLVFTIGARGRFNCLDGRSGKVLWTYDIVDENHAALPQWGKSCSPLVVDDLVVVSAGGPEGHSLVAYQKRTGQIAWQAGNEPSSYASPRLVDLNGMRQILIVNEQWVSAHAPDDGRVLWEFRWPGGQPKVADAVAVEKNHVFIAAGYGLGCKLLAIEQSSEDKQSAKELWKNTRLKPKFTNVVAHDGYVYGLDDGKTLVCLDLKGGKVRWHGGRYGHGQILLVNGLLLVQAESGEVALVAASPKRFQELARFTALDGQTWNNPVVAGRRLLVRNATEAACFELAPAEE